MKMITSILSVLFFGGLTVVATTPLTYGACSTAPLLVSPADFSELTTICPLLKWNCQSDPAAVGGKMQLAKTYDFSSSAFR